MALTTAVLILPDGTGPAKRWLLWAVPYKPTHQLSLYTLTACSLHSFLGYGRHWGSPHYVSTDRPLVEPGNPVGQCGKKRPSGWRVIANQITGQDHVHALVQGKPPLPAGPNHEVHEYIDGTSVHLEFPECRIRTGCIPGVGCLQILRTQDHWDTRKPARRIKVVGKVMVRRSQVGRDRPGLAGRPRRNLQEAAAKSPLGATNDEFGYKSSGAGGSPIVGLGLGPDDLSKDWSVKRGFCRTWL